VTTASRSYLLSVTAPAGDPSAESSLRSVLANLNVSGLGPQHVPQLNPAQVDLGRLLFFDKELSGIRDMACATCHHPSLTTGDGLNLSVGVGGVGGIGPGRTHPAKLFIARNAPPLFNLGTVRQLFWDMRVSAPPIGTPGSDVTSTPEGPMNLPPLVAQALLPLADITEMRGTGHALDGLTSDQYRNALLQRLMQIPGYVQRFNSAFGAGGMTVENIGRAIAAYELSQTFVNSPYDRYLRGENDALTDSQKNGALVFFGRALCSTCHAGPELTNVTVHNLGIPQFGPGQGNGPSGREDFGSENVTGDSNERYAFRVPPLRNVAFTAPYMHNGAFETLEEVIQHYNDKEISTAAFTGQNMTQAADLAPTLLPHTPFVQNMSISFTVIPNDLTQQEKDDLVQFLLALTDPQAINRTQEVPQTVPSGQPVDR
jgi:cytochrome c peroxidase